MVLAFEDFEALLSFVPLTSQTVSSALSNVQFTSKTREGLTGWHLGCRQLASDGQVQDTTQTLPLFIRGTALVYRDLQRQNKPLDELASPPSK